MGEPSRRLCVDYRASNNLVPPVMKAHSKAKGILTLIHLSKINEIYTQLTGSKIYSTIDLRSRYYHIALSVESQRKSAFVTPARKSEFQKVPSGLAQTPAYLQRLISEVLSGIDIAFRYLYYFFMYRPCSGNSFRTFGISLPVSLDRQLKAKRN